MSSLRTSPVSSVERRIVSALRSQLGSDGLHAERGMRVDEVRSAGHGDGARIEVRFRHSARPGSSFVVRFPLVEVEIDPAEEECDDDTVAGAITVIWANMMEIAALPNDYLPRRVADGEVEVFAW